MSGYYAPILQLTLTLELIMELPALITVIALLEFMFFSFRVGFGRAKFNVPAPAVSGNEVWERYFRVQQNTMEQMLVFLPLKSLLL